MAETTTLTLTDFLLARIAEDEADARYLAVGLPPATGGPYSIDHPARVLAECDAKRRIVESCRADYEYAQGRNDDTTEVAEEVLWHLALVYADHPAYRDEWKS